MSDALNRVFHALADPIRRQLLEKLQIREGLSLGEMADGVGISRFGVMKHLAVLEEAGLIRTRRAGRLKLHYLDAEPLGMVQERWLHKFTAAAGRGRRTA